MLQEKKKNVCSINKIRMAKVENYTSLLVMVPGSYIIFCKNKSRE